MLIATAIEFVPQSTGTPRHKTLVDYAIELGLAETQELRSLRELIVALVREGKPYSSALERYRNIADQLVTDYFVSPANTNEDLDFGRVEFSPVIMELSIYLDAGDHEAFESRLAEAMSILGSKGFYDIQDALMSIDQVPNNLNQFRERIEKL